MENILQTILDKDFSGFKESITNALYSKIADRIQEAKLEISSDIFGESAEDASYKEEVNHADKDGYPEDNEDNEDDEDDEEPHGGEFLVDLKFTGGNETELKNFRVSGISKQDVESRLNGFFGKGKFEVQKIKVNEEVEQLDELKDSTYKSYIKKAKKKNDSMADDNLYGYPEEKKEMDNRLKSIKLSKKLLKKTVNKVEESKLNPEEGKWHVLDGNTGKIISTHSKYNGANEKMKKLSRDSFGKGDNRKFKAISVNKYNKDNNIS